MKTRFVIAEWVQTKDVESLSMDEFKEKVNSFIKRASIDTNIGRIIKWLKNQDIPYTLDFDSYSNITKEYSVFGTLHSTTADILVSYLCLDDVGAVTLRIYAPDMMTEGTFMKNNCILPKKTDVSALEIF